MQRIGGRCDHKDLHGRPENYINQGRFRPGQNEVEAAHIKSVQSAPVCVQTQPSSTPSLTVHIRTFWVIKEKEKRSRLYFYTSVLLSFSAIQQIHMSWCHMNNCIKVSQDAKNYEDLTTFIQSKNRAQISWNFPRFHLSAVRGSPLGVVVYELDYELWRTIVFNFRLIPLEKEWISLSHQEWVI